MWGCRDAGWAPAPLRTDRGRVLRFGLAGRHVQTVVSYIDLIKGRKIPWKLWTLFLAWLSKYLLTQWLGCGSFFPAMV